MEYSIEGISNELVAYLIHCSHDEYMQIVYGRDSGFTPNQSIAMNKIRSSSVVGVIWQGTPREPKAPKEKRGCVYLIKAENGLFKIGYTFDFDTRFSTLKSKLPVKIVCEHVIHTDTPQTLEKDLHRQFLKKRFSSEWFALSQSDIAYIKSL